MLPKWLLVCATKPEWSELKKQTHFEKDHTFHGLNFYRTVMSGKEILLAQIGVGYELAKQRAYTIFHSFVNPPQRVIHFGLSGALAESMKVGDLMVPTTIVNEQNERVSPSADLLQKTKSTLESLSLISTEGTLLTSGRVLATMEQKKEAGKKFDALAVDMETYPIAIECEKAGIPFLAIRAIWDPLDWDLSLLPEMETFDRDGNLKTAHFLKEAITHPRLLMALPRYQAAAAKGNKKIGQFILEAINKWE